MFSRMVKNCWTPVGEIVMSLVIDHKDGQCDTQGSHRNKDSGNYYRSFLGRILFTLMSGWVIIFKVQELTMFSGKFGWTNTTCVSAFEME